MSPLLSFGIAWRFLKSSPLQSLLIAGGIAVGISTQIFVGSLITSLQDSLVEQTIGSAAQITVQDPSDSDPVTYSEKVQAVMEGDERLKAGTIVKVRTTTSLFSDGTDSSPLNLIGGELEELDGIYDISGRTVSGDASLGTGEIMIGTDFAKKYSLRPGDSMRLTFPGGRSGTYTVRGIFDLGSAAFNERQAFVSGEAVRSLLGWSANEYTAIQAQLDEPFESDVVAADWRRRLPGVSVVEWQAQNADLLTALTSQSSSSYLIQAFVLIAVALGIASTLAISAVQKTRQIGILKAMGLSDRASGRIFLFQALLLGGFGSIAGVALALLFIWSFSLAPVPFSITVQPAFAVFSASIGIAVALLSSIIPTRRTSRLDPIEVIQSG